MRFIAPLLAVVSLSLPAATAAQSTGAGDGVRFGISVGGISAITLDVELFRDSRSLDFALGTWSFRDVSFSAVAKQYFGSRAAQPFAGLGLWIVGAPGDERTGWGVVLRAPVGVDWEVTQDHALGAAININRALGVRRSDPNDEVPLNKRLVPLPQLYYRYTR
ncbi:MAG: hypothetical protein O2958_10860 [Gemmatimonadetes bacterium]|nr:hypothetical protein [Gemmatimonadota bacterium]MDA1104484.1 hypothetical protein [Gemmatimonadota bacterium]